MSRPFPFDPSDPRLPSGGGLPTHKKIQEPLPAPLDVVAVISNPIRYNARPDLYRAFARYVADSGARLTTVELAYGERPFEVTESDNPRHVQLRTGSELWHKENLVNVGITRLPRDWSYVAWIDADVRFARPDWVQETLHQLQHYQVVQMFSQAQDLCPDHTPLKLHNGFMYSWEQGLQQGHRYECWHPGFAWAARRDAINDLGGLIDWAILGSGDRHIACALIGRVRASAADGLDPEYYAMLDLWQERAERYIRRNVGCVPGLLNHYWHGKKADRRYRDRWKVLVETQFDPVEDLKRDWQGVWSLTDHNARLRDGVRRYFRCRNEDSIDRA